jgi:cobalamin biosynthesis protein CobT
MQGFEDEGIDVPPYLYYVWELYGRMSEMPISFHIKDKDIKEEVERIVDETFDYAILARGKESTQELLDVVLDKIYPLIKHWLDFPEFMCEPLRVSFTFSREKAPFYENSLKNLQGVAKLLEEKMKRLLSDNLFSHYAGAYLTGKKVNEKRLYRFGTGNFKLFERKIVAKKNNYVFALLVDESGSMTRNYGGNGENIKKAVDTAIVFSLVLEKLGIDYELWGFNTGVRQYKKAGGRLDTKIFERMFLSAWAGDSPDPENDASYNCDGFAIKTVFESLMRSPKEKVLFVISDGCPAPPFNHGERLEFELAKAEKKIKVVGFGIGNGTFSVPSFYRHNVVCDNVKELPTLLVKQIGKYLK